MAKYYRVAPMYWKGDRRHWNDREKLLALYLLTCEHRNLEGFYYLPKGYIATDLKWPEKAVDTLVASLQDKGFLRYDADAEVVLVVAALAHQAPSTEKQIAGAVAALRQVPSSCLRDDFLKACETHAPSLANAIRISFGPDGELAGAGAAPSPALTPTPPLKREAPAPAQEFRLEQIELPGGDLARLDGSDFVQRRIDGALGGWLRDHGLALHADDGILLVRAMLKRRIKVTRENVREAVRLAALVEQKNPGFHETWIVERASKELARNLAVVST